MRRPLSLLVRSSIVFGVACGVSVEGMPMSGDDAAPPPAEPGKEDDSGPSAHDSSSSDASLTVDAGPPCVLEGGVAGGPDGGPVQQPGLCDGVCVDLSNDPSHCGACATGCKSTFTCEGRQCVDVATPIAPLRVELPCVDNGSPYCRTNAVTKTDSKVVGGSAGKTYRVVIRVRGVVEQKSFTNTTDGGASGANPAFFAVGGQPDNGNWNNYSLEVTDPPGLFRLNRGASGNSFCDPLDYTATIMVKAGATVRLSGISVDPNSAKNCRSDGSAIVVADVPPAPAAFNGQFVQMDVVSVTPAL